MKVTKILMDAKKDVALFQTGQDEYVPFSVSAVLLAGGFEYAKARVENDPEGTFLTMTAEEAFDEEDVSISTMTEISL